MFTANPPPAPAPDSQNALNALWAFVEGIGLDPAKVVEAYATHDAFALGATVGTINAAMAALLSPDAASLLR